MSFPDVVLPEPRDRLSDLLGSPTLNGVDYVEIVASDPTILRVHFLNTNAPLKTLAAAISGGDSIPTVTVDPVDPSADWSADGDGRPLLTLHLPLGTGDFSNYILTLTAVDPAQDSGLDLRFSSVAFSFKALCPDDFDCVAPPRVCAPDDTPVPPIDYTAKDFGSFVQALGAYSAQAYPGWQERSEADLGVVVMEALAALADELSYYQDRVAAEATLATATQRRSLVSLARLVDYEPAPAQSASVTVMGVVAAGLTGIPAGVGVSAVGADGSVIPFEIGLGLNDPTVYPVSASWNFPIPAYWWDDGERCLGAGATEMWVQGAGHGFVSGMRILIQTDLPGESRRQIVTLTQVEIGLDQLYPKGGPATPVTRIAWNASDALTEDRNLSVTNVGGNLMPATQGARAKETFAITDAPAPGIPLAIARRGPNATDAQPNYVWRWPLAQSPIAWLPPQAVASGLTAANALAPEIALSCVTRPDQSWRFASTLLNAGQLQTAFTIDPVAWIPVATNPDGSVANWEMNGDGGESLRFGDGVFGAPPDEGGVFAMTYRVGRGGAGNVPADTITLVDKAWTGLLTSVSNPFAAAGGADAETATHIRNTAPFQFQASQARAVRPEDYVAAAETLPWVYRAGCAFRWTGSWLSVFTVADPAGVDGVSSSQSIELTELLNRRRLAGYESFAPPPTYVSLDLVVQVCVGAGSIGANVEAAVLARLSATASPPTGSTSGAQGFFFADRFTFGVPLYRSALEAAIQAVPGVNGVLSITWRQRGVTAGWSELGDVFQVAPDAMLRIENNPDYPERGTLKVIAEGGA
jgi:uncharacterized phage protein gp47/JayE